MKTWPTSLRSSFSIDPIQRMVQQTVLVAAKYPSLCAPLTRTIAFGDIESVYLDVWEDSRTVEQPTDEDGAAETLWIRRRWMVGLQLNDGETVTLYEDVTDQPARDIPELGPEHNRQRLDRHEGLRLVAHLFLAS